MKTDPFGEKPQKTKKKRRQEKDTEGDFQAKLRSLQGKFNR